MRMFIASVIGLAATAAMAAEVDFSSPIRDLDGKPVPSCAADTAECHAPLTLSHVAEMALLSPSEGREQQSLEEKVKRFELAVGLHAGGKLPLSVEDVALLKRLIGSAYAPLVVGRANEILDPPAKPKDK